MVLTLLEDKSTDFIVSLGIWVGLWVVLLIRWLTIIILLWFTHFLLMQVRLISKFRRLIRYKLNLLAILLCRIFSARDNIHAIKVDFWNTYRWLHLINRVCFWQFIVTWLFTWVVIWSWALVIQLKYMTFDVCIYKCFTFWASQLVRMIWKIIFINFKRFICIKV